MRHVLSVNYDPEATCPEFDAAVAKIFETAQVPKTLITFSLELMGYTIQLRRDIPIILVMFGAGSNGKSSLIKVLIALLSAEFVHSGRVDELEEARFAVGNLLGKLVFVDDDVRAGAKLPDGILKKLSEAKLLTGEQKFKPAFSFVNRAFPILLCSNLPSLADLSLGMIRLACTSFPSTGPSRRMRSTGPLRYDRQERSPPGVLNCALVGWQSLKRRKRFPTSKETWHAPGGTCSSTPTR